MLQLCFNVGFLTVGMQCCWWDSSRDVIWRMLNSINDNYCVIICQGLNVFPIDGKSLIAWKAMLSYEMKMMNDIYFYYKLTEISKFFACFSITLIFRLIFYD